MKPHKPSSMNKQNTLSVLQYTQSKLRTTIYSILWKNYVINICNNSIPRIKASPDESDLNLRRKYVEFEWSSCATRTEQDKFNMTSIFFSKVSYSNFLLLTF